MGKRIISQTFLQSSQQQKLQNTIAKSQSKTHLKGLIGSSFSFVIANAFKHAQLPFLLVFNDKEEAAYYLNDLEQLVESLQAR